MEKQIPVWDLGVRIFHWSLVALFTVAYLSGDELETVHAWSGYAVIGLLLFRIVWGFVGSRHARFTDFIRGPKEVVGYLKSMKAGHPRRYLGHNPAGGAMVLLLLIGLSLVSYTGLKVYATEGHGPLAGAGVSLIASAYADDDDDDEGLDAEDPAHEFWEEVHELAADFMLILIFLHVAGVVVSSRLEGENLVRAMITGRKRAG